MGIEPTSEAWEAYFKARKRTIWRHFCVFGPSSNGFQLEQRRRNERGFKSRTGWFNRSRLSEGIGKGFQKAG